MDTIFLFFCTLLVMLMTPALALFYGGLVRSKNVLSTTMHSYASIGVVAIQWVLIGNFGILLTDLFPEAGLDFLPMTALAACFVAAAGGIAHWYQKHRFLANRPARIIMISLLVIVMVISFIGQAQADPLDLEDDYYATTQLLL